MVRSDDLPDNFSLATPKISWIPNDFNTGTEVFVTEKVLFCNDRNQYVDANGKNYIINEVVCTNRGN